MSKVIIKKSSYDYPELKAHIFGLMDSLGGNAINKGSSVVIKPNLLAPAPPESAMLTHPLVVRAVAEYVNQKGAVPQISDSPAMGSFEKILQESGLRDALKGLDVTFSEFKRSVAVDVKPPFNKIEVAEDALNADFLINLPKLKTHAQMLLTLGVKNLFGCIVGLKKPEWHFRTGIDREMFARVLVQVCIAVNPSLTIIDGILAMEGQGPGKSGKPRELRVIMGSNDAFSLDAAVCRMLGMPADRLLTNKIAREMGALHEPVEIEGELSSVTDFKMPEITSLVFGPQMLHGFMRKHLVQRPVADDNVCRKCGECWKYCPAQAITLKNKKLVFDYDKCIRCYCCIEVCPQAALSAKDTLTGRIVRQAFAKKKAGE